MKRINQQRRKKDSGFSLIEIMLVVAIISILIGVAAIKMKDSKGATEIVATEIILGKVDVKLSNYEILALTKPTTEQGLQALVARPSVPPIPKRWQQGMKSIPVDAWGNELVYRNPGTLFPNGYDLLSVGVDGIEGTEDDIIWED